MASPESWNKGEVQTDRRRVAKTSEKDVRCQMVRMSELNCCCSRHSRQRRKKKDSATVSQSVWAGNKKGQNSNSQYSLVVDKTDAAMQGKKAKP